MTIFYGTMLSGGVRDRKSHCGTLMNRKKNSRALDYLDQKGVFKITKTSLLLCDAMQISKYTLYNYLEEARISRKSETNE